MLLNALKPRTTRGATRGGALPVDGFCVLGLTMADLYSHAPAVEKRGGASPSAPCTPPGGGRARRGATGSF